ncbi:hypothetical protein EZS27_013600 [termite gut metagenome]|jgi:hypothetical protein|uniref:Uncharacterized protein n=1 Tax=termite gut metagenome TaxID=433724 RepID=A0A5J4RXB5_9ZZZZ
MELFELFSFIGSFIISWIIGSLVIGILSACIASFKNRIGILWFLWGVLYGIITLIVIACCKKLEKDERDSASFTFLCLTLIIGGIIAFFAICAAPLR